MNTDLSFNYFWQFVKTDIGTDYEAVMEQIHSSESVTLPHDWLIYDTQNLYENSIGWYVKEFDPEAYFTDYAHGDRLIVRFDGVYMDSTIYLNDKEVGEWKYGYTTFEVDMSEAICKRNNRLVVKVKHQSPNSRWYSGGGIYRNVWLIKREENHIHSDGVYVHIEEEDSHWRVDIDTEVTILTKGRLVQTLAYKGQVVASDQIDVGSPIDGEIIEQKLQVIDPHLWSVTKANLYDLTTTLIVEDRTVAVETQKIGFRTIVVDSEKGFFLNGEHMKLNGVCEHHDLGCLGAAFNEVAMRRRLVILKDMGVNAIRCAHNMPAPEVMDLCDEMGIMVVSESFDMWSKSKTDYDYGRFFDEWSQRDVERWVKRDRNHVSLIMWSIGNEIYDTHMDERGQVITKRLMDYVYRYDPKKNAPVTIGSNYMPWENAQKCADMVKYAGYNYAEKYYEAHHSAHPDWFIYGSETSSIVQSRGVYHFPLSKGILAEDDQQCSALGNSTTSWGAKSIEECIAIDRDLPFSLGQFLWTGFDYIGEPTPYHTKNAYFGQIDTAGFPKDTYYVYQAAWTSAKASPMVHLFPYWDFNEGQLIDVRVCSNGDRVELFLNDRSMGIKSLEDDEGTRVVIANWQLPYSKGSIKAIAYDAEGRIIAQTCRSSFGDANRISLKADRKSVLADGTDLVFVEVSMLDEEGHIVENANNRVHVEVIGEGELVGIDNGDSTDYDNYKSNSRRLFAGKALVVVGSILTAGDIDIVVTSETMTPCHYRLSSEAVVLTGEAVLARVNDTKRSGALREMMPHLVLPIDEPIRKIELIPQDGNRIGQLDDRLQIDVKSYPSHSKKQDYIWRVVDDSGIDSNIGRMEINDNGCTVSAVGDGEFRLRCMVNNGKKHPDIISQLEFIAEGLGVVYKNPYELICAGLYDECLGEVTNGNERGVATSRDGETAVLFRDIDFGDFGSDEITLPIFALDDNLYEIECWQGMPYEEGSEKIDTLIYQKPSIWNVYQEAAYKLPKRLKGLISLAFLVKKKVHIKGFTFTKKYKAYEALKALECDGVYGDSYRREKDAIVNIGNNVTIIYEDMDFGGKEGDESTCGIEICGRSNNEKNMIRIQVEKDQSISYQIIEFEQSKEMLVKRFDLEAIKGFCKIEFVFLPGSNFDFKWFRFIR